MWARSRTSLGETMSATAHCPETVLDGPVSATLGELVHKVADSEVLVTGWRAIGPDAYHVTARWPERHGFYGPAHGFQDPLLLAESVRQSIPLLSHAAYGAPFGHRQSWSTFSYALDPAALAAVPGPTDVDLYITCSDIVRRGGRLVSLAMQVTAWANGRHLGAARTEFGNHAPEIYRRLRGGRADLSLALSRLIPLAPPMRPARVARTQFRDVVLSPTDTHSRTQLRVDPTHPVLFDHPVDHVPGMLLLEGVRQAGHSAVHPRRMTAVGMDCSFRRYAELDAPCWLQADLLPEAAPGRPRVLVTATQDDACVFSATVTLAPLPAA
jgi:hypothetical protein